MNSVLKPEPGERVINFYRKGSRVAVAVLVPAGREWRIGVSIRSERERNDNHKLALHIARGRARKAGGSRPIVMPGVPSLTVGRDTFEIWCAVIKLLDEALRNNFLPRRAWTVELVYNDDGIMKCKLVHTHAPEGTVLA